MNINFYDPKYDKLIKKIKIKRTTVIVLMIVCIVVTILGVLLPWIDVMDGTAKTYDGSDPFAALLQVFFVLFIGTIVHSTSVLPLFSSLDVECDPYKHLILNSRIKVQKNMDSICSADYFYLGNYGMSLNYAGSMVMSGKVNVILVGLFYSARCEYMLGNYIACKNYAEEFAARLASAQGLKPKQRSELEKMGKVLILLCAIAEDDQRKINELCAGVEVYNASKGTECFVNYVKGIAAYKTGDSQEAIYRFKCVTYNGSKTAFAALAEQYLETLK